MRPIQAGDLVVCIKPTPCCGCKTGLGFHFVVASLYSSACCGLCFRDWNEPAALNGVVVNGNADGFAVSQLKRIPPLEELNDGYTDEEVYGPPETV